MSDTLENLLSRPRATPLPTPNVLNPLAAMGGALSVAGDVYRLRGAQATEAVGQALQQAIDPATGEVSYPRFRAIAAGNPSAAMGMQSALSTLQPTQNQAYTLHMARLGNLSSGMGQLLADYPHGVPSTVVNQAIDRAVKSGVITEDEGNQARAQFGDNPIQNSQLILQHMSRNLSGQQALDAALPGRGTLETGQGTVGYTTPPRLSVLGQQGSIHVSGTPIATGLPSVTKLLDQVGQPVYGEDARALGVPDGTTIDIPLIQRLIKQGAGGLVFHGAPGTQSPTSGTPAAAPVPPPPGTTIRSGYQPRPGAAPAAPGQQPQQPPPTPGQPATTAQPAAAPAPGQQPPTAPAPDQFKPVVTNIPGVEEANKVSAAQYAADNANAGSYQQRIWPLANAARILETNAPTTGQGAEAARSVIGHLQTLSNIFTGADIQSIKQAKFEELNKYLTQAVNANPMAQGSDMRLASAITGNPSTHISNLANKDILKAMIGLERMKQMAITDFNNQGLTPAQYSNFLRQWQTTHDPRAFIVDMLKPEQQRKMFDAMKPSERATFDNTFDLVERNPGILTRATMP